MKKNRRMSRKLSVVTVHFMHLGAVLLTLFLMVIFNMVASSRCTQLERTLGQKRKVLERLDEEFERESARWEEMKTSERLEAALVKHGLSMHYPKASQIVRMRTNGTPYPGQLSISKLDIRARGGSGTATASVARPTSVRRRR